MDTTQETVPRSALVALVGALAALGALRIAVRLWGLLALLGIVAGTVAAFAVGILVLRVMLGA